jgi:hypothetical protein
MDDVIGMLFSKRHRSFLIMPSSIWRHGEFTIMNVMMAKMPLRLLLLVAIFAAAHSFTIDRRELLSGLAASVSLPSVSLSSVNLLAAVKPDKAPRQTKTKAPVALDPVDFSGVYRDPQHPAGYRVVRSVGQGLVSVTLQDDANNEIVKLDGTTKYNMKTGETSLAIDFSPKGGPTSLNAEYSPDRLLLVNFCEKGEVLAKGSIGFPDGNVWIKDTTGIQGVYSDPNHMDGYRVIRELGSAKLSVELADRVDQVPLVLSGIVNKYEGTAIFNFSPKGGSKKLSAKIEDNRVVFPDGNIWTKL